ncbi:metallophosphoesterase [Candidatus Bathyarchaeota archaeon]|nr:metallophosphoesterase [Candidatus Bathyarchaeota archaeon]
MTRIFHSVDAHGSNLVWKKYLSAASSYKADVILLCGDLTGKAVVPVIKIKENEWFINPFGKEEKFNSKKKLEERLESLSNQGYYIFETTKDEVASLQRDPKKVESIFANLMRERLGEWLEMVEERIPKEIKVVVMPGNDDIFDIDEVIKAHEDRIIYPLKKVVYIDDKHPMISVEYVNPSPWETPREAAEPNLMIMLEAEHAKVDEKERQYLICNFHAPPYNTTLDLAPKLDKNLNVVTRLDGSPEMVHVGSKSVRDFFERYQPRLGLHGHIHEAAADQKIGRTKVVNPGSDYQAGVLRGYVVDLTQDPNDELKVWRVEG